MHELTAKTPSMASTRASLEVVVAICSMPFAMDLVKLQSLLLEQRIHISRVTVYPKCGDAMYQRAIAGLSSLPLGWTVQELPNHGRNDATYLHHITQHFASLDQNILFMKDSTAVQSGPLFPFVNGSIEDEWGFACHQKGFRHPGFACDEPKKGLGGCPWLPRTNAMQYKRNHRYTTRHEQNKKSAQQGEFQSPVRPLRNWMDGLLDEQTHHRFFERDWMPMCHGGSFLATRRAVTNVTLASWTAILNATIWRKQDNAEESHFMERCWAALLSERELRPDAATASIIRTTGRHWKD